MGLLRGVARTAVVAGTASAVSGRVQRRQQGRWAAQEAQNAPAYAEPQYAPPPQQYAPPPPPQTTAAAPVADDMDAKIAQLRELAQLRDQGVITDAELATQKARILGP